uniref:Uncharacterized protein n=1 Tax=Romanomermis culicivorax TaxID=13658 RepID=A0A915IBI1_ROMCU
MGSERRNDKNDDACFAASSSSGPPSPPSPLLLLLSFLPDEVFGDLNNVFETKVLKSPRKFLGAETVSQGVGKFGPTLDLAYDNLLKQMYEKRPCRCRIFFSNEHNFLIKMKG